jgi:hypothetical protein
MYLLLLLLRHTYQSILSDKKRWETFRKILDDKEIQEYVPEWKDRP